MTESTPIPAVDNPPDPTSIDAMFHGAVQLEQSRSGYRFSVDAVLLAHRVAQHRPRRVLEIGSGCGVVILCATWLAASIERAVAVEVQPSLARLTAANIVRNGLSDRVTLVEGDVRQLRGALDRAAHDVVCINPPYFRPGHGHQNPNAERAAARHQLHGTLHELLLEARFLLAGRGHVELVMPAHDLGTTLATLAELQLNRQSVRLLFPRAGRDAELAMIGAARGSDWRTRFEEPLVMYAADGTYTPQMAEILAGVRT